MLTAFAMLPILAIASSRKGYILLVCVTLVYAFCGFIFMSLNMYMLPLTSMAVIVMRNKDIPGIVFTQAINIPFVFLYLYLGYCRYVTCEDLPKKRVRCDNAYLTLGGI